MADHKTYISSNNLTQPTGAHFNKPGHNLANMKFTVLEKVKKNNELYRKEREHYLIKKFNTFHLGMNKKP